MVDFVKSKDTPLLSEEKSAVVRGVESRENALTEVVGMSATGVTVTVLVSVVVSDPRVAVKLRVKFPL